MGLVCGHQEMPLASLGGTKFGRAQYRVAAKLIVYGYVRGMRSSRKMQSACLEDVAFRILAAGQAPDFRIWRRWKEPSLRCCTCAVRRAW